MYVWAIVNRCWAKLINSKGIIVVTPGEQSAAEYDSEDDDENVTAYEKALAFI